MWLCIGQFDQGPEHFLNIWNYPLVTSLNRNEFQKRHSVGPKQCSPFWARTVFLNRLTVLADFVKYKHYLYLNEKQIVFNPFTPKIKKLHSPNLRNTRGTDNWHYYTTKLLGGLIQKIHQSDRVIAGLIFSKYQTGSVRIRPEIELFKMADAEEIEICKLSPRNTKQFLPRRRRPPLWAWFGHVKQSGKTRGSCWTWKRRSH